MPPPPQLAGHALILYDGVCGLCNRFVQFVLRRDRSEHFLFLALQDPLAAESLGGHGVATGELNSICLLSDANTPGERLYVRSAAVVQVLLLLGSGWRLLGSLLGLVPAPLRDFGYGLIARIRYRIFGRYATCPLPSPEQRARFLISDARND